ncbi:MAG: acyl-CoA dehydrogenase [Alphaproteobacteria bacterium]|nr:acyl-CoA dehydrogenase [Alphaproteobacteria bacterium]
MTYSAPIRDMKFVIHDVVGLSRVAELPGCEEVSGDLVDAILDEAAKFSSGVLAPLNRTGDTQGSRLENGVVRTPEGFKDAYRQFVDGGWNGVPFSPDYGGQDLPWLVAIPVAEMWNSANMAFSLCPLLNHGATELLSAHGSEPQKAIYLHKMVSGEWTGTMNLTEPQSGTDLGTLKTRAVPNGDHYLISGQKIFITYGDHDMAENVIHMVLARTPDAPAGTKGISLFIVPKFLVGPDGELRDRNDLRCISLEHKLGIAASPTAVMSYGDDGGAIGYLIGEEGRGLEYMFTMMNTERLGVGLQGLAISESAYQQALAYGRERVQSRPVDGSSATPVTIIHHPDVRRMLMDMKAHVEAMRGLAYEVAAALDRANRHPDPEQRREAQSFVDLMIPIVKAWFTDLGVELASTNIQIHGGMGFIEETGAAQHYRDIRIGPIYEGTNGIQANDLLGRKVVRDGGDAARHFLGRVTSLADTLATSADANLSALGTRLSTAVGDLDRAVTSVLETFSADPNRAAAGAVPFLRLFGIVAGGWMMGRMAETAQRTLGAANGDGAFLEGKLITARYYAEYVLPHTTSLAAIVDTGGGSVMALADEQF